MKTSYGLKALSLVVAGLSATWFGGSTAVAQTAQPHIAHIVPAGGQRGATATVSVRGRHLTGCTQVHVSGGGVSGKIVSVEQPDAGKKTTKRLDAADNPDLATLELSIDALTPPGERELRLVSSGGASNRFRFYVGEIPEVLETEPNSSPEEAQVVQSLPVVVNGQTFQADRDCFRFKAKAGQTLVFEAYAQRILPYIADGVPGWFQASLTLYDASGKEIAYVDDFRHHPDPVMIFKVPADGEYAIEIKDVLFRGRDDFVYRLRIGELPLITHLYPLGAPRSTKAQVKLFGVNLPTDKLALDLPADSPSRRWIQVSARGMNSSPLPFAVGDLPETNEVEPNNAADSPQRVSLPAVVNGRIDAPGDLDYYLINAEAKQQLVFEVLARRLESPMDSMVTVYDKTGRQLAQNDDTKDDTEGLVTHHSDSYLLHTFAAAGEYVVAVADVQGKGGEEYAYRLSLAPPQPDFVLRLRPDNPRAAQGNSALLTVAAFRRDGFTGPIRLAVKDLPKGFVASETEIAEKEKEARLIITTPADAPLGVVVPTVVGTATIGDKEVVREAVPAEDLLQAFYYTHSVPCHESLMTIVEAGPFMFSVTMPDEKGYLEIPVRGEAKLPLKVTFRDAEAAKGYIQLKPDTPPKGFRVQVAPLPTGKTETEITITTLGQQVNVGQSGAIIISATMRQGKETISGFVPAIPYKIVRSK